MWQWALQYHDDYFENIRYPFFVVIASPVVVIVCNHIHYYGACSIVLCQFVNGQVDNGLMHQSVTRVY